MTIPTARLPQRALAFALSVFVVTSCAAVLAKDGKPALGSAPVDLANPLVGTAPLDKATLIGNAPPPGEPLYTGMTTPGASLPQSATEAAPHDPVPWVCLLALAQLDRQQSWEEHRAEAPEPLLPPGRRASVRKQSRPRKGTP